MKNEFIYSQLAIFSALYRKLIKTQGFPKVTFQTHEALKGISKTIYANMDSNQDIHGSELQHYFQHVPISTTLKSIYVYICIYMTVHIFICLGSEMRDLKGLFFIFKIFCTICIFTMNMYHLYNLKRTPENNNSKNSEYCTALCTKQDSVNA